MQWRNRIARNRRPDAGCQSLKQQCRMVCGGSAASGGPVSANCIIRCWVTGIEPVERARLTQAWAAVAI